MSSNYQSNQADEIEAGELLIQLGTLKIFVFECWAWIREPSKQVPDAGAGKEEIFQVSGFVINGNGLTLMGMLFACIHLSLTTNSSLTKEYNKASEKALNAHRCLLSCAVCIRMAI